MHKLIWPALWILLEVPSVSSLMANLRLCLGTQWRHDINTHSSFHARSWHFRNWLVALSAPSHYLSQCWNIVNSNFSNKLQWNLKRNSCILVKKMHLNISSEIWRSCCLVLNVLIRALLKSESSANMCQQQCSVFFRMFINYSWCVSWIKLKKKIFWFCPNVFTLNQLFILNALSIASTISYQYR